MRAGKSCRCPVKSLFVTRLYFTPHLFTWISKEKKKVKSDNALTVTLVYITIIPLKMSAACYIATKASWITIAPEKKTRPKINGAPIFFNPYIAVLRNQSPIISVVRVQKRTINFHSRSQPFPRRHNPLPERLISLFHAKHAHTPNPPGFIKTNYISPSS